MQSGDKFIYQQFHGVMVIVDRRPPTSNKYNFIITHKGMDWSGYRTLAECEAQFEEIQKRSDALEDDFAVVERCGAMTCPKQQP
jgi:hypothetical protein